MLRSDSWRCCLTYAFFFMKLRFALFDSSWPRLLPEECDPPTTPQDILYKVPPSDEVLNFMWLKFLLIWRFFKFWSLVNGIEAPENMPKCINNWHASFNKWLVRYMYIPLGGSQKKILNVWVIFTFVAIAYLA